jgi:hypothetical protein
MRLQLPIASVRPPVEDTTGYTGVAAPKRKRVEEEPTLDQAPPKVGGAGSIDGFGATA